MNATRLALTTAIHDEISRVLRDHAQNAQAGACLYITHATATALHKAGLRPVIQAGSLQWPIMTQEEDNGRTPTHFAYMWDPDQPDSIAARRRGLA
jgi:hypothetical protein